MHRNGPGADCVPRPLVSELPAGGALGEGRPAEVLALRYELGRLLPQSLLACCRRLGSGCVLRTASVSIARSSALFLVGSRVKDFCHCHGYYVGMHEGELNPR
jgi:hypothetical protein